MVEVIKVIDLTDVPIRHMKDTVRKGSPCECW